MADPKDPDTVAPTPLTKFRAAVARTRAYDRVDALISHPDPAGAIAALSVPELFFLVKSVGFADANDLIALAHPEQIRGCLDMDLWDRDQFLDDAARPWLIALLEAGYEKLGAVWEAMDMEVAALLLQRWTRVWDLSMEEEVPEDSELPLIRTPDTFFAVEVTAEHEDDIRLVTHLIDFLYRADGVLARHSLMSARSEPPAELEETSYRWRSGRMADLGYVDFYDALEVFRPLDASSIKLGDTAGEPRVTANEGDEARVPGNLPAPLAEAIAGRTFLVDALDRIDDNAELERLQQGLVYLINRVLAAQRVPAGDEEAAVLGAEHAAATVALGLETVSGGNLDTAVAALGSVSLTQLHRAGFTVALRLSRLAHALAPRAVGAGSIDAAVLTALMASRPWFPRELDDPPDMGWRAFTSVQDVAIVARALARLALRIAIVEQALDINLVDTRLVAEPPELDDYVRTALARVMAGGAPSAAPLGPDEIPHDFSDASRARARATLMARLDEAGVTAGREYLDAMVDSWLAELADQLGGLDPHATLDARFVTGLLLRPTPAKS